MKVVAATAALLALVLVAPAAAQTPASDADLRIELAQAPRLAQALPVTVRTTAPASYRATAVIRVAGKEVGETTARGRSQTQGTIIRLRVGFTTRARAAKQSRMTGKAPEAVVTVTATLDDRPGTPTATIRSALRRPPFYDGPLRAPDAPREVTRRFAVSWDLPFEFTQVYGALAGTPSPGTFRKYVAARAGGPRCSVTFHGSATTSRAPGRLRALPVRQRGTPGRWRFERGATQAIVSRRAPAALPGSRPWLVVRFGVDLLGAEGACQGEVDRTVLASLRRAIGTVAVRAAPLQLGPGFETA